MQISVVIIAKDAEKFISACVSSVKTLSGDIVVVVDSRTTDATARIAAELGSRVFFRDFDNFSAQKNFADSQAVNNWILSLDADESASPGLLSAIKGLPDKPLFQAYYLLRNNKIFGKYILHSNWDPYGLIRIFDKQRCHWEGEIHEEIVVDGEAGRLYDCIYHDNYRTVVEFVTRQDYYSTLQANKLYSRNTPFSYFRFAVDPLIDFCRRFFLHAGFLDNLHGLFLSYLMVVYHLSVWIKLWQKYQKVSS